MIIDFAAGELKGGDAERLETHMESCEGCRQALAMYKNIIAETKAMPAPVYSEEFWSAKLNEIKGCRPQRRRVSFMKPAILSGCAVLLFGILFARFFHGGRDATVKSPAVKNNYAIVLNELPYPEDTLIEMVDHIDEDSAEEILNMLFANNLLASHVR
jgi:anti-sigma factor RsiW